MPDKDDQITVTRYDLDQIIALNMAQKELIEKYLLAKPKRISAKKLAQDAAAAKAVARRRYYRYKKRDDV